MNGFPERRLRRLRRSAGVRRLFDEQYPGPERFIWPVFLTSGSKVREPIKALPGLFRYSQDACVDELHNVVNQGIGGILMFGVPDATCKDAQGSAAADNEGLIPEAVETVKSHFPDLPVFTDVCLCAYTNHGHCGPLDQNGCVDNDAASDWLARVALSHAQAGADGVAPSAMMDGQVARIRQALDQYGFTQTCLMSYSTKFASSFYGPFREAEQSSPQEGDRQGYQASYRQSRQALLESLLDEQEGADILMVKPALLYLDIIAALREKTLLPIAAYNVSGEYAMLKALADHGGGNLADMVRESVFAMSRAGADIIISYWAHRYNELIRGSST